MKRFSYFLLAVVTLTASACMHFRSLAERKVTFVLFDANEAKAMLPIFDYLRARNIGQEVVAIGPAQMIVENEPSYIDLQKRCGVSNQIGPKWPRDLPLPITDMTKIQDCISPTLLFTGTFSAFQEQVSRELKGSVKHIWGYFDSFKTERIAELNSKFTANLSKILAPSVAVKRAIAKKFPGSTVEVVGEPSMEEWRRYAAKADARKILENLEVTKTFPVIVYMGGEGKDYQASFKAFAKEASKLTDCILLVSLHPDANGEFEKKALEDAKANDVRIISKKISTQDAAIIADVVVNHRSKEAIQVVFLNKPVIYFDLEAGAYTDLAIESGWAKQVSKVEDFIPLVRGKLRERIYNIEKDIFAERGIPKDSVTILGRLIENRVLD